VNLLFPACVLKGVHRHCMVGFQGLIIYKFIARIFQILYQTRGSLTTYLYMFEVEHCGGIIMNLRIDCFCGNLCYVKKKGFEQEMFT